MINYLVNLIILTIAIILLLTVIHYLDLLVVCPYRRRGYIINKDTHILITGACMGIGRQIALQFARENQANIIILDIADANQILKEIREAGGKAQFYKCDISDPSQVEITVKQVLFDHHYIDILINNAGVVSSKYFNQSSIKDYQRVMNVNFIGPVQLIQLILPSMIQRKIGHVVNIASLVSVLTGTKVAEYVASKHAMWGFHHCLRLELQMDKSPIHTTLVCPHVVNTGMFKGFKTSVDKLIPMLDEKYVGKVIYDSIVSKREVVFIRHAYEKLLQIMKLLPWYLNDTITLWVNEPNLLVDRIICIILQQISKTRKLTFRRQQTYFEGNRQQQKPQPPDDLFIKAQKAKLDYLSTINLFSQMSQNRLKDKLHLFKEECYQRGTVIYKEDDPVDFCWLIINGEVQISSLVIIETLKNKQRVQLAIFIPNTIFGEGEHVHQQQKRLYMAQAITKLNCYKIAMEEFSNLLIVSNLYDQFADEFRMKEKSWEARKNNIYGNGANRKVVSEADILHKSYQKQVEIPKKYQNYIQARKLIWNIKDTDLNQELQQAHVDKQKEVQQLMNFQVKKQFKGNYVMRRLLIEGRRRNIHIEVMDGLNLTQYVNPPGAKSNGISKIFEKLRHYQGEQLFQELYSGEETQKDRGKLWTFDNAKLQNLRFPANANQAQEQYLSQNLMRIQSATSFMRSPPNELNSRLSTERKLKYNQEQTYSINKTRAETASTRKQSRPLTASTTNIQFQHIQLDKSQPTKEKISGKNSQTYFQDLFKQY